MMSILKAFFSRADMYCPTWKGRVGGAIIKISSLASICENGTPYIEYSISKAAVNQLIQSVAMQ